MKPDAGFSGILAWARSFCLDRTQEAADPLPSNQMLPLEPIKQRWNWSDLDWVLAVLLIFAPLIEGGTTQYPVFVIRLLILMLSALFLFRCTQPRLLNVIPASLAWPIGGLLCVAGMSVFWSPYKHPSVQWCLTLISYALLFFVTAFTVRSSSRVARLAWLMIGLGVCEGFLGVYQYVWMGYPRAKGTFFNPNFFATYEGAILLLVVGIFSFSPRNMMRWGTAIGMLCCLVVLVTAFVAAQSRGALAVLTVTLSILIFLRWGKTALVLLTAALMLGAVLPNPMRDRLLEVSAVDPYAYTRIDIWQDGWRRFAEQPLGIGLGMYKYGSFQHRFAIDGKLARYGKRAESAHNEYLQIAVELGIAGLLLVGVGLAMWFRTVLAMWRSPLSSDERGLLAGLGAIGFSILLHGFVDSVFHEPAVMIHLAVSAALLVSCLGSARFGTFEWHLKPVRPRSVQIGLSLICGLVAAAVIGQPAAGWYAYEQGQERMRAGNIDGAILWYSRAGMLDPGSAAYHDAVARLYVERFHQTRTPDWLIKASEELGIAMDLNPLDGRLPQRLARLYSLLAQQTVAGQGESLLDASARYYRLAMTTDPFSPMNHLELAKLHIAQGKVEEARALLTVAKGLEPNYLPGRALLLEISIGKEPADSLKREFLELQTIQSFYEHRATSQTEREFVDVDLYPLGRRLALEVPQ